MARESIDNPEVMPPVGDGYGIEVLGWRELIEAMPSMAKLLWRLARDPRAPALPKILAGLSALYLAMPIDLVPDFIPILGQLDDIVVLVVALDWLITRTDESVLFEHWDGDPRTLRSIRNTLASLGPGIAAKLSGLRRSRREYRDSVGQTSV